MHIVLFTGCYVDKRRDVPSQIKKGMELNRRLGRTEMRPREEVHTEIDGRRVEGVDSLAEIYFEHLSGIEPPRLAGQRSGDPSIDPPIAGLVCVRECRARNLSPKAHSVEVFASRSQA